MRNGEVQRLEVLVAHHEKSIRVALSWTLAFDLETSEASSGAGAVDLASTGGFDVVLLPARIKEGHSNAPAVAAVRDNAPGTQVLALAVAGPEMDSERRELAAMVEAGAVGYITQDAPYGEFLKAIRDAARGAVPSLSTNLLWLFRDISQQRQRDLDEATFERGERT